MSSDLEIALEFVYFLLRWLPVWLWDSPQVLALLLLFTWTTYICWQLLTSQKAPPLLSSLRTNLVLVLALLVALFYCHQVLLQLHQTEAALADSRWSVKNGKIHRLDLLNTLKNQGGPVEDASKEDEKKPNPLDGCLHVFIDLGSNRGLQIRKIYETHLFPLAPILPLYERYFGVPEDRKLQEICSVAFEPNPKHAQHLLDLSASYKTCGIKVIVFNNTGVGHQDTTSRFAPFTTLFGTEVGHNAAARLILEGESVEDLLKTHLLEYEHEHEMETVEVVRFSKFITDVVAKRKLPMSAGVTTPRVVIKVDIEGAELKIIPDMVVTGAFGHIDNLHMEWHGNASYRKGREAAMISKLAPAITALSELTISEGIEHKFTVEEMDDETYTGLIMYKPWGDYSELPTPTC